jgi:hypothetical protein
VFHVRVASNQAAYFGVDEGVVAVTGEDVTVNVVAGQSTSIQNGEPPDAPVFTITGEGEVTQTEPTWVIAGQSFETHEDTVFVGDPQIGDWVRVEGHLSVDGTPIADLITLLQRSLVDRFTITGPVDAIGAAEWIVADQTITVNEDTAIDEDIDEQDLVKVEGEILEGGELVAEHIMLLEDIPGLPFRFTGIVQTINDGMWTISGIDVTVDEETDVDPEAGQDDMVVVAGWILDDGTWLAREIKLAEPPPATFQFVGIVGSIEPWEVAGISFETDASTEIEDDIEQGDLVEVKGQILPDGSWLASEISQVDEHDDDVFTIMFVGVVDGVDPWVVSGIPLTVDDATEIEDGIEQGDLVKVTVNILPDGTWLATEITLFGSNDDVLGCMLIAAVVESVGDGELNVSGWSPIDLNETIVQGEITVGSVILMQVCVSEDGSVEIAMIVVIYQPESDVPPVSPYDDDDGDTDDDEHDAKITICHKPDSKNPQTITISRSAWPAHKAHGDTMGPCD